MTCHIFGALELTAMQHGIVFLPSESNIGFSKSFIWEGADNSLARPPSRCCRTESIVFLERGVCSCAELQIFSSYRSWKEACHATRAISSNLWCELSSSFFPARQGVEGNSSPSDRNIRGICTIIGDRQNWVAQFKREDFSICDAPRPGRPKTVTTP